MLFSNPSNYRELTCCVCKTKEAETSKMLDISISKYIENQFDNFGFYDTGLEYFGKLLGSSFLYRLNMDLVFWCSSGQ